MLLNSSNPYIPYCPSPKNFNSKATKTYKNQQKYIRILYPLLHLQRIKEPNKELNAAQNSLSQVYDAMIYGSIEIKNIHHSDLYMMKYTLHTYNTKSSKVTIYTNFKNTITILETDF